VDRWRCLRVAVAASSLLALVATGAAAEGDLADQLRETRQELESKEAELERTRAELAVVADQVRASDAELARMTSELAELERQLDAAREVVVQAQARTTAASAELQRVTQRLEDTRLRLEERERTFDDRVAAAYKYGTPSMATAIKGAGDVNEFLRGVYYIRSVMRSDRAVITEVTDAAQALVVDRAEADRLRDELAHQQELAAAAAAEAEDLASTQQKLTSMVETERARRAELMSQLEVEEALTAAEIDELQAESEALAEELRTSRWRAGAPGQGTWVWPTSGQVGSRYGYRTHPIYGGRRLHTGVDISGAFGQPIVAANEGLVVAAYCTPGGYGCRVVLDHGGGYASLYAHQSSFAVSEGEVVSGGQVIGYVGSTGASTGPHLHFEIRVNGAPADPMAYYTG
jgi:murein DD-endopeptidase MepM/ murein hydrolase activator NlpD